jgi:hypothetical protein
MQNIFQNKMEKRLRHSLRVKLDKEDGKPQAFRYVLRQSRFSDFVTSTNPSPDT